MKFRHYCAFAALMLLTAVGWRVAPAAVEVEGWGDLRGFRIDGQLFPVTTSLRVVAPGWKRSLDTGHWRERDLSFATDGDAQIYGGEIGFPRGKQSVVYQTTVQPIGPNRVKIHVQAVPRQDMNLEGILFSISVPLADYSGATGQLIGAVGPATQSAEISTTQPATDRRYLSATASGVELVGPHRRLEADFDEPRAVILRDVHDSHGDQVSLLVQLHPGNVKTDQKIDGSIVLSVSGDIDHQPAHLAIDAAQRGSPFDGIGGNFVYALGTPDVNYNLQQFHVDWARVGVPLAMWEPLELADPDPQALAANDKPNSDIRASLEMARTLRQRGIPTIFTLWAAPPWALNNPMPGQPFAEGRIVNPAKWEELCNGIASYLLYAKRQYGVEPKLFSLNETNLGVTIRLTPEQYRDAIKRIGACFVAHGIGTKILLGDVSNPHPVDFINPTAADPLAMQYVGALSYHSWNGATAGELAAWHAAAQKLGLPLLVAEAGTDSDAYHYPHVFWYTSYAIDEAAMYVDVLANSQPLSILPWEMTPDYPLEDFHGPEPRLSKRFWCLKQLSATSGSGKVELRIDADQPVIHAAALFDPARNSLCIHLVNMGAARDVAISGIPAGVQTPQIYVTDADNNFAKGAQVDLKDGTANVRLPPLSFVTLTSPPI